MFKFIAGALCAFALQAYGWAGIERLINGANDLAQTGYHHLENAAAHAKRGAK